jgi:hypothetical protein
VIEAFHRSIEDFTLQIKLEMTTDAMDQLIFRKVHVFTFHLSKSYFRFPARQR